MNEDKILCGVKADICIATSYAEIPRDGRHGGFLHIYGYARPRLLSLYERYQQVKPFANVVGRYTCHNKRDGGLRYYPLSSVLFDQLLTEGQEFFDFGDYAVLLG